MITEEARMMKLLRLSRVRAMRPLKKSPMVFMVAVVQTRPRLDRKDELTRKRLGRRETTHLCLLYSYPKACRLYFGHGLSAGPALLLA